MRILNKKNGTCKVGKNTTDKLWQKPADVIIPAENAFVWLADLAERRIFVINVNTFRLIHWLVAEIMYLTHLSVAHCK